KGQVPSQISHSKSSRSIFSKRRKQKPRAFLILFGEETERYRQEFQWYIFHNQIGWTGDDLIFCNHPFTDLDTEMCVGIRQVTGTVQPLINRHLIIDVLSHFFSLYITSVHFSHHPKRLGHLTFIIV